MNPIRTKFKAQSTELELLLANYKNSHPKNFSSMVRAGLSVVMIILAVLLAFDGMFDGQDDESMAFFMVSGVLLIFGVVMYVKFNSKQIPEGNAAFVLGKINTMQNDFKTYPDVQNYVEKCRNDLSAAQNRKKKIKSIYYIIFGGFLAVFGLKVLIVSAMNFANEMSEDCAYNKSTWDGFCKILNLKTNVPFLSLKPLKSDVSDGIKLETQTFEVFLDEFYSDGSGSMRVLSAMKPVLSGCHHGEMFRLSITDENGKPVERCPRFSFSAEKTGVISSYAFCYDVKEKKQNTFQTLQTLRYLQANQGKLRFEVEKL